MKLTYQQLWVKKNQVKVNAYQKAYRTSYYLNNKEKINKKHKEYYNNNKTKRTKKILEWRRKNRKKCIGYVLKYNKNHKDKIKLWLNIHKDKVKKYQRKYRQTEKGKINMIKTRLSRKASKMLVENTLTARELKIIKNKYKKCVYCGSNKELTYEHIISLRKKGNHSFHNVIRACISCNSSKGTKDVFEWCKSKNISVPRCIIQNLNKMEKFRR